MVINRKTIWSLSWPVIIANVTIPLVGLTDTIIMGHMPNSDFIAAVGLGGLVFNFIYASLNFFRMGTTGIVAQNFGRNNSNEIILSLFRPLILSILFSLSLILSKEFIFRFSIQILNPENSISLHLQNYFYIRINAIIFGLINIVFLGWFFGLQKSKSVMIQIITINVSNVIFSIYFAVFLNQGIQGIALGSVLAQISGFLVSLIIFLQYYKNSNLFFFILTKILKLDPFIKLFHISKDLFIRTTSLIIVKIYLFKKAILIGVDELAALEILIVIFSVSSSILDAFAHTAETTVGNSIGSKNFKKLKYSIRFSTEIAILFSMLITFLLYIFQQQIIFLITDIKNLINLLNSLWFFVILTPMVSVLAFQLDGIFIGATLAKQMRNSMILSVIIFYILIEFVFKTRLNIENLYTCFLFFLFSRGFILSFSMQKVFELAKN